MEFDAYTLDDGVYDEMFQAGDTPHPHCRNLREWLDRLSAEEINGIQEWVTRSFLNEGITFTVYGENEADERIIPIDCLPRIVSAGDWRQIESGLTQRILALNRFLADVYGAGRIVDDGVIPADMVYGCPQYRREMRGVQPAHGTWVSICGTDVVRTIDGFHVLEDNLRVPSGVSYMIANRKAIKSSLRRLYRQCRVREVEDYGRQLLQTLREIAPADRVDPSIAVLTPGVANSAFYEHMFLAHELGAELVEGRDLVVMDDVVYMKTTEGLRRIDVIYRRIDDDFLDPRVFRPDSVLGVPGVVRAHRAGNVALANVPGTGVADDKSNYAFVPDMIRYYLGEEPILANVPTHLCRRPEDLEYTLDNLERLVVKETGGSGGYGMLVRPHASVAEREEYAKRLRANPAGFIAQPVLALSRGPCVVDGRAEPRHVDLRPYVLRGQETRIVPGAFCRVALRPGSLGRPIPGADGQLVGGGDDDRLVDSFALADDLTFERTNVDSVWSGFSLGRENARQMRHYLSAEVWTNLNRAYLRFRKLRIEDIWKTAPETFYEGIAYDIDAPSGAADATMYHDDAWRFLRMGRFNERAQLTISLILAHIAATRRTGDSLNDDWSSLLRVCQAVDVYRSSLRHGDPTGSRARPACNRRAVAAVAHVRDRRCCRGDCHDQGRPGTFSRGPAVGPFIGRHRSSRLAGPSRPGASRTNPRRGATGVPHVARAGG